MKILLLIDNLGSGGAQNQLSALAKELSEQGHEIVLVTYYPQNFFLPRLKETSVQHIQLQKSDRLGFNILRQLRKIISTGQFDLLLSFLDTPNFYLSAARKLCFKRPPIIISYRSQTMFGKISWMELQTKKWMNRNATAIIANSHHERKAWITRYPRLKDKFYTIYNAVDLERFKVQPRQDRNRPLRLLCVGSISIDKNGMAVVEAMDRLINEEKANVQLTWVGEKAVGIKSRKEYIDQMEQAIEEKNLNPYWTWKNPTNTIHELFYEHDVLIHASTREGLPNVVCEALSCGTPLILSNILDHPILADNQKNGLLFDPKKPEELLQAVLNMNACTSEEYLSYHEHAADFAKKSFGMEKYVNSFTTIFKKLVSS